MLEDFILKSAKRTLKSGLVQLSREGFVLVVTPNGDSIRGYGTVHRERTWEQVKAGVRSRFKSGGLVRTAAGPAPDEGPAVDLDAFPKSFEPAHIYLTARVRQAFAKLCEMGSTSDGDLDEAIRSSVKDSLPGDITQCSDGGFELRGADVVWRISADCRRLIGIAATTGPGAPLTSVHDASPCKQAIQGPRPGANAQSGKRRSSASASVGHAGKRQVPGTSQSKRSIVKPAKQKPAGSKRRKKREAYTSKSMPEWPWQEITRAERQPRTTSTPWASQLGIPSITKSQVDRESRPKADPEKVRKRVKELLAPAPRSPKSAAETLADEIARDSMRSHKPSSWRVGRSPSSYS